MTEEDYGGDIITLTDDEGNSFELEHLDTLEVGEETYMAFTPANATEESESAELIILKVAKENGDEILVTVDDEKELEKVYELFMKRIEESEETDN